MHYDGIYQNLCGNHQEIQGGELSFLEAIQLNLDRSKAILKNFQVDEQQNVTVTNRNQNSYLERISRIGSIEELCGAVKANYFQVEQQNNLRLFSVCQAIRQRDIQQAKQIHSLLNQQYQQVQQTLGDPMATIQAIEKKYHQKLQSV